MKRLYYKFRLWLNGFRKPNYKFKYVAVMPPDISIRFKYVDKDESV